MRALGLLLVVACGTSPAADASFDVPLETWTWIDVPGMSCGNGSPTGIAINPSTRSHNLVLMFEGGGACWDAATCYGILIPVAASHLDGFNAQTFASVQGQIDNNWAFQRSDPTSPFHDATWVFVPYCTGDLHAGTKATVYSALGQMRTMHHVGGTNVDAMLEWLSPYTFDQIFAIGISAGGFGVQLNWDRIAAAFPGATTNVLADGAQLVPVEAGRWGSMKAEWAMRFPTGCAACADRLDNLAAYWRTTPPTDGGRYGLLASLQDAVLGLFFGYDAGAMRAVSLPVATAMTGDAAAFMIDNTTHTMLGAPTTMTSTGVVLRPWVEQWAAGTGAFMTAGP
jgi:hypothetical protein